MGCKIYSYPCNPRVYKVLITAQYSGERVEQPSDFQLGVTNKTPEFLAKFPFGKVPAMETCDGPLFESNAMAYYVAQGKSNGTQLIGQSRYEAALIQQYINMADNEISPAAATWIYPIMGYVQFNETNVNKAKEDVAKVMGVLNEILLTRTFLVGESITLADIAVVCALYHLYTLVLDAEFRKSFVNLNRWFLTCVNQVEFKAVLGETELCTVPKSCECSTVCQEKKLCGSGNICNPAKKCEGMSEKTCGKPSNTCVVAPATTTTAMEEGDEDKPVETKEKNPMDLLPAGKFNMDSWKRFYSNNETRPTAVNFFWENFDSECYSMYRLTYKYNQELTKVFMSSNLIGGFFQRLEEARKYAFGSMGVFGQDNDSAIYGMFIFRGQDIPPMVKDCPDFESYDFDKVDPTAPSAKEEWEKCIAWEGEFEGKKYNCGKVYK